MQIWVPDVRSPRFAAAAHTQSAAIAASEAEAEDQAFVDAISTLSADWAAEDGGGGATPRGYREAAGVRRGELYSAAARGADTGKPRPVVIVQDDRFDATASITVCPLTTNAVEAPLVRIRIEPDDVNGLDQPSSLMVDKLTTIPRASLGGRLGHLTDEDRLRLVRAVVVFLGLA